MYIRKITRKWKTREGAIKERSYYYWYKSRRIGDKVISECIGRASEDDYVRTHSKKPENANEEGDRSRKPTVSRVSALPTLSRKK